jgi:hypothetical protein
VEIGSSGATLPSILSSVHVILLNCNACGAPLQVPVQANFVTCTFCSAQLAVRRTEGAITTEALEAIAQGTLKIGEDLETIKLHHELERLDREWTMGLDRYRVQGKDGHYSVPSATGSIFGGVIVIAFGIFWMIGASSMGAPGFFPLFGLIFIGVAVASMVSGSSKAVAYEQARQVYERRRQEVLHEISARSTAASDDGRGGEDPGPKLKDTPASVARTGVETRQGRNPSSQS